MTYTGMQELEGGSGIYHAPCRTNHYSHKNNPLVATSLLESSLKKQRFQLLNCFHPVPFKRIPSLCWDTINWRFHQIFWIANDSTGPPPNPSPRPQEARLQEFPLSVRSMVYMPARGRFSSRAEKKTNHKTASVLKTSSPEQAVGKAEKVIFISKHSLPFRISPSWRCARTCDPASWHTR